MMNPDLAKKVVDVAKDFVIFKPLARWNEQYNNFPRFVMEYLVTQYVDPDDPIPGQKKIDRLLSEHYIDSSERELIRSRIRESGSYKLIGDLKIRLDAKKDVYWADVPAIGENTVRVAPSVRSRYEDMLLTVGAWGQMTIEYDPSVEIDRKRHPFAVVDFVPFQLTRIDLNDFLEIRGHFTLAEWLDLMVESIGFAAETLSTEVKLLMMLRLVPFVEANYNLIELGPRETGKTYTYRNTSSRGFVISGSKTTAASLFWAKTGNKIGILGQKEVVSFDEIAHAVFPGDETLSVLKDYMQTGKFTRLGLEFQSDASIVLGGNIDTDLASGQPSFRYIHLFEPLPNDLQDTAFLDRLHAYLPGWRMPKIIPAAYSRSYGFVSDYLAEVFHLLRRHNLGTVVEELVDLDAGSDRNATAIKKTTAGLLKLLYPTAASERPDAQGLAPIVDLAISGRRTIVEQLACMLPGEYDPAVIKARPRAVRDAGLGNADQSE
jgi:ATP-dependent Lon protease